MKRTLSKFELFVLGCVGLSGGLDVTIPLMLYVHEFIQEPTKALLTTIFLSVPVFVLSAWLCANLFYAIAMPLFTWFGKKLMHAEIEQNTSLISQDIQTQAQKS